MLSFSHFTRTRLASKPLAAWATLVTALAPAPVLAQGSGGTPAWIAWAPVDHWLAAMLLMMGLTIALLARLCPTERRLSHLAGILLSAFAWSLVSTVGAWLGAIGLGAFGAALALALVAVFNLCAFRYVLGPFFRQPAWVGRALRVQLLLAPLSVWVLGNEHMADMGRLWAAVFAIELLLALFFYARLHGAANDDTEHAPPETLIINHRDPSLLRAILALQALLASAYLILQLLPPAAFIDTGAIARVILWAAALALMALGLQTIAGLARARKIAELRHALAEQEMHARVAEVELSFGAMVEQKLELVTERERKRIAADLHDDLGAKLLTIVHTSESDRISSLAREALEEMRLSVRGLTGKPVQLLDALGDWRAELVSRLGQANIMAEWEAPAEDIVHTLPARAYVQTTRIFREAVSNIIKHSGATHCNISCKVQEGDFLVVIQDNGQGIPAELDGRLDRGHGMASMKSRAKQMQGQCLVESGPGWGTVIRLTIPL